MSLPPAFSAPDLTVTFPRSPRTVLRGFVVAAGTLDKCRAALARTAGEYRFTCPLDNLLFEFTIISAEEFKEKAATGATDGEFAAWLREKTTSLETRAIIQWNNDLRDKRISEMTIELQEFLEGYTPEFLSADKIVSYWFDVYDIEEQRI